VRRNAARQGRPPSDLTACGTQIAHPFGAFALTHILIEVARAHDPDREQDRQRHNDFHRFVPHGKNWRNKKLQAITCGGRECANTECSKKKWADIRSAGKVRCGNDVTRFDAAKDDAERTVYRKQRNRRWPPSPFHIEERALARVASLSELDAAVAALVQQRVAALFFAPQADFRNWRQQILALAEYQQVFRTVISSSLEV
jgi:hypothetical protein